MPSLCLQASSAGRAARLQDAFQAADQQLAEQLAGISLDHQQRQAGLQHAPPALLLIACIISVIGSHYDSKAWVTLVFLHCKVYNVIIQAHNHKPKNVKAVAGPRRPCARQGGTFAPGLT